MLTIIHGDNQIQSREALMKKNKEARTKDKEVLKFDAAKLTLAQLEQALNSQNLFGQEKLIVIETLHSLPTSKNKKALVEFIVSATKQVGAPDIVLWEKRKLTATMLKKFSDAQATEFKISQKLWQFLDSLGNTQINLKKQLELLDQVSKQEEIHFVYLMIIRQVRLLIQAKEGHFSGAPFMIAKLRKQANYFSLKQLLQLHQQLFFIDAQLKTSTNLLDLKSTLDLFVISLYK